MSGAPSGTSDGPALSRVPRILFLSLVFAPDGVSTAQLMTELAVDVQRAGSTVVVITTRPHYNRDVVAEAAQPLHAVWPGLLWRSEVGGVRVYHTCISAKAGGVLTRAFGWAAFHLVALVAALTLVRQADVIFVPSPLLSLGALGRVLATPLRAKLVYNVQELYPDLAVELGMIRNPVLIGALRMLERFVYRQSAVITAITDGIRSAIISKGVPPERVLTVPNFVDVSDLTPGAKVNEFSLEHGLTDKFVVMYAGNMGYAQGLEALIEAARLLREIPDIVFCFVGAGAAKPALEEMARGLALENVRFMDHQPYARVPAIYAASDLDIVALVGGVLVGALPSKVFRIMACGRPLLALCDPASDLATIVETSGAGEVRDPQDPASIAAMILSLRDEPDRRARMAERGREYVVEHLSRSVITTRYAELFRALAEA